MALAAEEREDDDDLRRTRRPRTYFRTCVYLHTRPAYDDDDFVIRTAINYRVIGSRLTVYNNITL